MNAFTVLLLFLTAVFSMRCQNCFYRFIVIFNDVEHLQNHSGSCYHLCLHSSLLLNLLQKIYTSYNSCAGKLNYSLNVMEQKKKF